MEPHTYEEREGIDPSYRSCKDPRVIVVSVPIVQQDLAVDQNLSCVHSICVLVHVGTERNVGTVTQGFKTRKVSISDNSFFCKEDWGRLSN